MALQLVYLGTPNNNDGDSLYAGGTKINANFSELYTQLAGATNQALRIDLGTALIGDPVSGDTLEWSPTNEQFIPSSSTMLKTLAGNTNSFLALTNNTGKAGVDEDYTGQPNALELILNGRRLWNFRATTTGTTAATRGTWYIGMGNPYATSLAISTRGVTVGGVDGLTVVRNTTEEGAVSATVVTTGSSGLILYQTPIIHQDSYKAASDSSGAIIHSGFVQNAIDRRNFAANTSTVTGIRGLAGGGALSTNPQIYINAASFPTYIEGLLYNVGTSVITVTPGAAVHYSYSTTGETGIGATNPTLMLVTTTSAMSRAWTTTAWAAANTSACLDTTIAINTWFYLYLVATSNGDTTDFVISSSRDYASTQSKLTAASGGTDYKVIRRLGAFRTTSSIDVTTGAAAIEPIFVTRQEGNTIRVDYLGNDASTTGMGITTHGQLNSSTVATQFIVTSVVAGQFAQGLFNSSAATTATAASFSSQLIRAIPPLPGVKADIAITQVANARPMVMLYYGEPVYSSTATTFNTLGRAALQRIRPPASTTSVDVRAGVLISPDNSYISDTVLAGQTVFGSTSGSFIRYAFTQPGSGNVDNVTPSILWWDVQGFTIAR